MFFSWDLADIGLNVILFFLDAAEKPTPCVGAAPGLIPRFYVFYAADCDFFSADARGTPTVQILYQCDTSLL